MIKWNRHIILSVIIISGLIFIQGCKKQYNQEAGFLEGIITIGPLCPVETDPPDPGCLPTYETYKAYPVSIWTSDGGRKITQLNPDLDGSYQIELEPGNYLIVLETGQYRIGTSNLPAEMTINSQKNTILNINIDTGIR